MKRVYFFLIYFISFLCYPNELYVSNIINPFRKIDLEFHNEFEDSFLSVFSIVPDFDSHYLYREEDIYTIKKNIIKYKDNSNDVSPLLNEINKSKYSIFCDIIYYEIKEEFNFYDSEIIEYYAILKFNIVIIQGRDLKIIEEEQFDIQTEKIRDKTKLKEKLIFLVKEKLRKYRDSLIYFKKKIRIVKSNTLFIWLNAGRSSDIKETDIILGYDLKKDSSAAVVKLKVIKAYDDFSVAIILFNTEKITDDIIFFKKESSNLELKIAAGFSLSEIDKDNLSFYPYMDIRILVPVRVPFFNPVINVQLNFFFKNNKFIVPFSFETGIQTDFNINRFRFGLGGLVGVLFSPDDNLRYQIDTVVLKPYLFISAIINSVVVFYFEFGYRYLNENVLYNYWEIDLEGIFFTFGINFTL